MKRFIFWLIGDDSTEAIYEIMLSAGIAIGTIFWIVFMVNIFNIFKGLPL